MPWIPRVAAATPSGPKSNGIFHQPRGAPEQKKVPSDPQRQLVRQPACAARTWHRETILGSPLAPLDGYWPPRIVASGILGRHLPRSRRLEAAFHSPRAAAPSRGPPLRVRRSRPASSTPRRTGLGPVRPPAPLPAIRMAESGEAHHPRPVARTICPALSTEARALLPVGTIDPSGSPLGTLPRERSLPPRNTRSPFTPRPRKLGNFGGRINVRGSLCQAGLAVPRTSWNQIHDAPKGAGSQTEKT